MKHIIEMEEITINVSWGHIAAKWWGPRHIRPIVMLHGWQANAGTFDPLIALLPRHVSYLAIDFPGHGLSSPLPNGMIYSHMFYVYVLRLIHKKFDWKMISLCGHSMGSILCFLYASSFPSECDMVIGLDFLQSNEVDNDVLINFYSEGISKLYKSTEQNVAGTEPPSYSRSELVKKLMNAKFTTYTEDSLEYLLVRGMKESKAYPKKYYFTRDNRVKTMNVYMVPPEVNVDSALRITAPYCFIKALQYEGESKRVHVDEILHTMTNANSKFELHGVDSGHHVHLTEPEKVSTIISRFIEKYRQDDLISKL